MTKEITVPNSTEYDDDIQEAYYDAVGDGEGRLTPYYLRYHLAKHGLFIHNFQTAAEVQEKEKANLVIDKVEKLWDDHPSTIDSLLRNW